MSLPKDLNGFKENHCTTLIPEPNSNSFFIKIPVSDYNELSIIKTNLLTFVFERLKPSFRMELSGFKPSVFRSF